MSPRRLMHCVLCLGVAALLALPAWSEDLSGGPFYEYSVEEDPSAFVGCKDLPQASFEKTSWESPYGRVSLLEGSAPPTLRENAYMLEDERGVLAVDSYEGVLAVEHDGSLAGALMPGSIVAGSFGIREVWAVSQQAGSIDSFVPVSSESHKSLALETRHRQEGGGKGGDGKGGDGKGGEGGAGFVRLETRPADFGELFCDAEFKVEWIPIQEEASTSPIGGGCGGHSPCNIDYPIAQENSYEAPSFDPFAHEGGVEFRGGGVFNCPKVFIGVFQIRPSVRFEAPQLDLTVRVRQGVARLDGAAGIEAGLLISLQEKAEAKLRCEADFLRMAMGGESPEIPLATFPVFGVPVTFYLKPFVTGFVELKSGLPRIEADLTAGVNPTMAVGWDGGPLAEFALNPEFTADVAVQAVEDPWDVELGSGVDFGAELGVKAGGTILGIGAELKLFTKAYQRFAGEIEISDDKPCVFNLTATAGSYISFGVKFVLKLIITLLQVNIVSEPMGIGDTIQLFGDEFDLASFGCDNEPEFEIPMGGIDQWVCSTATQNFGGLGAQQQCLDARAADTFCQSGGANPHGQECSPVGATQALCSSCAPLGFGGLWSYDRYACSCSGAQPCDYPCCVSNDDCNAGELCNSSGQCEASCDPFGFDCETNGDCCSGNCECVFGCGPFGPNIMACGN